MRLNGNQVTIVDLPGTYSLTAYSLEEVVARDFLVNEKPAMIINIIDASNLERNLYLTLQFIELGIPVCLALNMMDMAESRGIQINAAKLSKLLGLPVVPIVARTNRGKNALTAAAADLLFNAPRQSALNISYGSDIDNALEKMTAIITEYGFLTDTYPARWTALKYLESDEQIQTAGLAVDRETGLKLLAIVNATADHIRATLDSYPEAIIADQRYGYIQSVLKTRCHCIQRGPQPASVVR